MKTTMKKIICSLFLSLAAIASPSVVAGSFGSEVTVSGDSSQFPEVAYYSNTIHVVWVGYASGKLGDIFYSRSTDSGASFSTPVNLSNTATSVVGNDHPQVTAGPNGVFVAWNSDNNTGAAYWTKVTGPSTFTPPQNLGGAEGGTYTRTTSLFTDSAGRIHAAYYDSRNPVGVGHVFHRVMCDGTNWGTETAVTSQLLDGDFDNEEPHVGEVGGKVYIVYRSSRNGNPQGGWAPYSIQMQSGTVAGSGTACAVTWSYPARRIAAGLPLSYSSTYMPAVFGDGTNLHVAWWDLSQGANVFYRKGNPSTGFLGQATNVSQLPVSHPEPGSLSSTPAAASGGFEVSPGVASNGTDAYIAYQQNSTVSAGTYENGQIYLRESTDNGATWNSTTAQPISTAGQATTPRVAVSGANLAIVYSDIHTGSSRIYFRMYHGVISGPSLSLTPNPVDLGSIAVGAASASVPVTVQNVGTSTATLSGTAVSGADFQLGTSTCGATLAASATCVVNVNITPSALGTRSGTLSVSSNAVDSPGTTSLTAIGVGSGNFAANASAVVTGYYENILGREPDSAGRNFWIAEANRVVGLGANVSEAFFALSISFFNSPEYIARATSNTQYLTDLYHTFFSREPDTAGLNFWLSQMSGGMDRSAVLVNFLFSTEFGNTMTGLFGAPTARAEANMVIDLYRGLFGRLPDSAGYSFYLGQIRHAQCQGGSAVATMVNDLATQFVYSQEYGIIESGRPAPLRNNYHMADLYNAIMRRGPDLAGYNFYAGQLNSGGMTRDAIRAQFIASPEFQNRLTAVINQGCIPGS